MNKITNCRSVLFNNNGTMEKNKNKQVKFSVQQADTVNFTSNGATPYIKKELGRLQEAANIFNEMLEERLLVKEGEQLRKEVQEILDTPVLSDNIIDTLEKLKRNGYDVPESLLNA